MYFTGDDGCQHFLVFSSVHSSLTLNNKNVTNWILTEVLPKNKPFDINHKLTMSNLVLKIFYSLYSNFILSLYIVYKLNNCPHKPSNNFTQKIVYLVSQVIKKRSQE